jgi:hypothetical protein
MECVDKRELEQFLKGDMAPERLVAVDEHVTACASCKAALEAMPLRARTIASFGADLVAASDCPDYDELSALVEENLDRAAARSIQAHVNMCEVCAGDVEHIQELRSQAALRGGITVRPGRPRGRFEWRGVWRKVLAGAMVAAAIAVVAVTLRQPPSPPVEKPAVEAKAPGPRKTQPRPEPAVKPTVQEKPIVAAKPDEQKPAPPKPSPVLRDGTYNLVRADGGYTLARADGGSVRTPLEKRVAALIAEKIRTGKIKPAEPTRVALNTIRLRGEEAYTPLPTAPKQISPVGVVVRSDRPTFTWSKVDMAESYRLIVTDKDGNTLYEGITDKTALKLSRPLERGRVYIWQVGARFSKSDSWANSRAAGFRAISAGEMATVQAIERRMPGSHLALAAVYESVGLYGDAAQEYRAVRRANPGSRLARGLAAP